MKSILRGQFRIADLLLAIFVIAAWTGFVINQRRTVRLQTQIQSMRQSAGELDIGNRTVYHAIGQLVIRYPDEAWQVYLPEGGKYQLNFASREIRETGFPSNETQQSVALAPGTHRILLHHDRDEQKNPHFQLVVDKTTAIEARESKDWAGKGSNSVGIGKSQETLAIDKPLVLKRLRVTARQPDGTSQSSPGNEPVNGILVWITHTPTDR